MSFEDVSEKLRRNVVLLSAIIIASYLFGLRLAADVSQNISTQTVAHFFEIENKHTRLIWIFGLIMLAYVYCRYWFDEKSKSGRKDALKEYTSLKLAIIQRRLKEQICNALYKNSEFTIPYSSTLQLTFLRDDEFQRAHTNRPPPSIIELEISDLKFNRHNAEIAEIAALGGLPLSDTDLIDYDSRALWTGTFKLKTCNLKWGTDSQDKLPPLHAPSYSASFPFLVSDNDGEQICISSQVSLRWRFWLSKSFFDVFIVDYLFITAALMSTFSIIGINFSTFGNDVLRILQSLLHYSIG